VNTSDSEVNPSVTDCEVTPGVTVTPVLYAG